MLKYKKILKKFKFTKNCTFKNKKFNEKGIK